MATTLITANILYTDRVMIPNRQPDVWKPHEYIAGILAPGSLLHSSLLFSIIIVLQEVQIPDSWSVAQDTVSYLPI